MNPFYGASGPAVYDGRKPEPPYAANDAQTDELNETIFRLRTALQNCLDVRDGVGGTPPDVWETARKLIAND